MKKLSLAAVLAGLGLLVSGAPAAAHHSFAAEYDANKPVTLKGVVSKIEWTNPHARFYIDVKDETGTQLEPRAGEPERPVRKGWTRKSLKIGDEITVAGLAGERRLEDGERPRRDARGRQARVRGIVGGDPKAPPRAAPAT